MRLTKQHEQKLENWGRLIKCFSVVFPKLKIDQIDDLTTTNSDDWTSITLIQLITAVEVEFGIEIDLEHLGKLNSFQAFLEEVEK